VFDPIKAVLLIRDLFLKRECTCFLCVENATAGTSHTIGLWFKLASSNNQTCVIWVVFLWRVDRTDAAPCVQMGQCSITH